jgi:hypothetical protein
MSVPPTRPIVAIRFDCTPLRSVRQVVVPSEASPAYRSRLERVQRAISRHGTRNTYYLTNGSCTFQFTNDPDVGWVRFTVEGTVLTASLAAESNFDLVKLANYHVVWYFHAAYVCLAVGFVLSVWASGANCCCAPTDKVELSGIEIGSGDLAAPLFDENRHQLSPSSRRLLS